MKIRTIARQTFASFLRNRLMIVFLSICVCIVLLMLTPLLGFKMMTTAANAGQMKAMVIGDIAAIMFFLSGVGSWLAAWAAADSVASEMKAGTILAVMARPVKRWEFLLGKFLGVMTLMLVYVLMMFALSWILALIAGERIDSTPWVLIAYPLVRYAMYSALAMLLVTFFHPLVTLAITMVISVGAMLLAPSEGGHNMFLPEWLRATFYSVFPSTGLLSEERFYTLKQASLKQIGWLGHLTTLGYGLNYAFVCLLLAMWSFHYRSLARD